MFAVDYLGKTIMDLSTLTESDQRGWAGNDKFETWTEAHLALVKFHNDAVSKAGVDLTEVIGMWMDKFLEK